MNLNPGFLVMSGILALLALVCLWFWYKFHAEVALIMATPVSPAGSIPRLPPGTIAAVSGRIECDAPITGEFSGQVCVYSKSMVERKETRQNKDGNRETTYTIERSTERHTPFAVADTTGRATVQPEGANVEAVEVFRESSHGATDTVLSIGMALTGGAYDRRYIERILAPGSTVYAIGTVLSGGALGAAPSGAKVREFIITHRSREERTKSSRWTAIIMLAIAIALFAGAGWALWAAYRY